MFKRRSPRIGERLTPCQCCGHPISQRHHPTPVRRYGEHDAVRHLCANCHEAFHIFDEGWLDHRGGLRDTRAIQLWTTLYHYWGGKDDPRVRYINELVEQAELHQAAIIPLKGYDRGKPMTNKERQGIRRGDVIRLSDGQFARVVSVASGYIHTTVGTYGPWQVERIAKGRDDSDIEVWRV